MAHHLWRSLASAAALLLLTATVASAADGPPPPPRAANGATVKTVATGVATPTAFAFAGSTVFAGSGPSEVPGGATGLFTLKHGVATRVPGTPPVVFGLAWHHRKLYVSSGAQLIAYRGWNGTRFAHSKVVSNGRRGFPGFNGIAFGPDGRLYAGISLDQRFDHSADPAPLAQSVVSMRPNGKHLRIVARGLRQPFQLTFPGRARHPYVTVLAQDATKRVPPDTIVVAKRGQDYGFPTCVFPRSRACRSFAKPRIVLPGKHASPMGIGSIGRTLYVSLFGPQEVVKIPLKTGKPRPFLTGFVAPVIALGVHGKTVYVGDLTGTIYKVRA